MDEILGAMEWIMAKEIICMDRIGKEIANTISKILILAIGKIILLAIGKNEQNISP